MLRVSAIVLVVVCKLDCAPAIASPFEPSLPGVAAAKGMARRLGTPPGPDIRAAQESRNCDADEMERVMYKSSFVVLPRLSIPHGTCHEHGVRVYVKYTVLRVNKKISHCSSDPCPTGVPQPMGI
jgi:hypothetical protein